MCIDEFGPLNLLPRHGFCNKGPGKRVERLRATYNRKGGIRHFLAFYDLETNRLYGPVHDAQELSITDWNDYREEIAQAV